MASVLSFTGRTLSEDWQCLARGSDSTRFVSATRGLQVAESVQHAPDGRRWQQVSVWLVYRVPTWEELTLVKEAFIGKEQTAFHVLASTVNTAHPYLLHLWCCLDGEVLPTLVRGT